MRNEEVGQTGRLPRYVGQIGDLSKPVALRLTGATLWLSEETSNGPNVPTGVTKSTVEVAQ